MSKEALKKIILENIDELTEIQAIKLKKVVESKDYSGYSSDDIVRNRFFRTEK